MKVKKSPTAFARSWLFIVLMYATAVLAGPGHDHGDEIPSAVAGDGPKRQATGKVFLPKPAQRQLAIRTEKVKVQSLAKVIELNGKVVTDPQTGGMVQTTMGGQFMPAGKGVPELGQKVQKGQILGYIHRQQNALEKSAQQAQLAQLQSQLTLAERRLERIQKLIDTLPKKDIDSAQTEVYGLKAQISALSTGIHARETLRSPSNGVIASSAAISGKIFTEAETVFEVVNPKVLRVEAPWYEINEVPQFLSATVSGNGKPGNAKVNLKYLGASGSVKEQSLTLVFETRALMGPQLPIGQLLKIYAELADKTDGIAIPSTSVVKNPSNQSIVWVKKEPEMFQPQVVLTEPLNGAQVLVRSGLSNNDLVVVQGAALVNQVR